jgi:hypothetical protein
MNIEIGIELTDRNIVKDLFETPQPKAGEEKSIGEGVSIRIKNYHARDAVDLPTILNIVAYIGEHVALPVAVALLSRYLYDKLKDRRGKSRLIINYTAVEIDAEKIEQLVLNMQPKEKDE